jgi:hypothetical protein
MDSTPLGLARVSVDARDSLDPEGLDIFAWSNENIQMGIGGQFLRAYVEAYNNPPVANLITYVEITWAPPSKEVPAGDDDSLLLALALNIWGYQTCQRVDPAMHYATSYESPRVKASIPRMHRTILFKPNTSETMHGCQCITPRTTFLP